MTERQTLQAVLAGLGVVLSVLNMALYAELWLCRRRTQDLVMAVVPLAALLAMGVELYRLQALLRGEPVTIAALVRVGVVVVVLIVLLIQAVAYFREGVP